MSINKERSDIKDIHKLYHFIDMKKIELKNISDKTSLYIISKKIICFIRNATLGTKRRIVSNSVIYANNERVTCVALLLFYENDKRT